MRRQRPMCAWNTALLSSLDLAHTNVHVIPASQPRRGRGWCLRLSICSTPSAWLFWNKVESDNSKSSKQMRQTMYNCPSNVQLGVTFTSVTLAVLRCFVPHQPALSRPRPACVTASERACTQRINESLLWNHIVDPRNISARWRIEKWMYVPRHIDHSGLFIHPVPCTFQTHVLWWHIFVIVWVAARRSSTSLSWTTTPD